MARISVRGQTPSRDFSGAMTDISFLLIIFFIVSAIFVTDRGILLKLPDPETPPRTLRRDQVVTIEITEPGAYTVDGIYTFPSELRSALSQKTGSFSEPIVVLIVASGVVYQEVLAVLEEARSVGYTGFSLETDLDAPIGLQIEPD